MHLANSLNRTPNFNIDLNKIYEVSPSTVNNWELVLESNVPVWVNRGEIQVNENFINEIKESKYEEVKKSNKYYLKRIWFFQFLFNNLGKSSGDNPLLVLNRENILEDTFNQFQSGKEFNLKVPIFVNFSDELNSEQNVYREWYASLFNQIFDIKNGFFQRNPNKSYVNGTLIINEECDTEKVPYFEFFGKLLGKAIIDKVFINDTLNYVLLKLILQRRILVEDLKYFDLSLYNTLLSISNCTDDNTLSQYYFVWDLKEKDGSVKEIELIEGGKKISLTVRNKGLFIDKVIKNECYYKYQEFIDALKNGLKSIIPLEISEMLTIEEFDFLISGQNEIDIKDWKKNTLYSGEYNENHPSIVLFWKVMEMLNNEQLSAILYFSTGNRRVPIDGFNSLIGLNNKITKFSIESVPLENEFKPIEAITCINKILLPEYNTKEEMINAFKIIFQNVNKVFES